MLKPATMKSGPRPLSVARRKHISRHQDEWVSIRPLFDDKPYPTLIESQIQGLELAVWGENNRELIDRLLWEKRSLLFRGFNMGGTEGFERFVLALQKSFAREPRSKEHS